MGVRSGWELPPLARGRVKSGWNTAWTTGITPARAGKRDGGLDDLDRAGNYPRSRGEEARKRRSSGAPSELPPLARGRGRPRLVVNLSHGITPARAGKRFLPLLKRRHQRNYPRSRGEEPSAAISHVITMELPPLARGRAWRVRFRLAPNGITPARAGKSPSERRPIA